MGLGRSTRKKSREKRETRGGEKTHLQSQILTKQSLPPVTNLLLPPPAPGGAAATRLAGAIAGAQLTALAPMPCAGKIWCSQLLSLNSSTLTLPSDEAQARRQPLSCGDQDTMFTEAVCRANSKTLVQSPVCSRQISTLPS